MQSFLFSSHELIENAYSMVVAEAAVDWDDDKLALVLQQIIVAAEVVFFHVSSSGGVLNLRSDCPSVEQGPCGHVSRSTV